MRKALIAGAALLLAGCETTKPATPEPIVITKEVAVPVAVSCVSNKLGGPPQYVDSDEALRKASGPDERYQLVYAGRTQRIARQGETEPAIEICRKAGIAKVDAQ